MSEEEILKECTELAENEHHELGDCWDEEYSSSAIFGLIMLYKQTKKELNNLKEIEKSHQTDNGLLRQELDMQIEHNKELEDKQIWNKGRIEELKNELVQEKERNKKYEKQLDLDYVEQNFISKDKIKEKIVEIINSSSRYNVLCKINENEETRRTRYTVAVLKELLEEK